MEPRTITVYEGSCDAEEIDTLQIKIERDTHITLFQVTDQNDDGRARFALHSTSPRRTKRLLDKLPERVDVTYEVYCKTEVA